LPDKHDVVLVNKRHDSHRVRVMGELPFRLIAVGQQHGINKKIQSFPRVEFVFPVWLFYEFHYK